MSGTKTSAPKGNHRAVIERRFSQIDRKSEQVLEDLLSLLLVFEGMGLLQAAGPHIHQLMALIYDAAKKH